MESDILYNQSPISIIEEYTVVKSSGIQGHGLFAKKLIPEGTVWWHARSQDILIVKKDQFLTLVNSFNPPSSHKPQLVEKLTQCLLTYSYYDADIDALIFCLDNARYVNHSSSANSIAGVEMFSSVALRDIQPGEEITEDYSKYKKARWASINVNARQSAF